MSLRALTLVLWITGALDLVLGIWFLASPASAAQIFPWPLPPLGARFMGALFLAGSACTLINLAIGPSRGLIVLALLAVGDLLIASVGVLAIGDVQATATLVVWLALFVGPAVALLVTALPAARGMFDLPPPMPRSLRRYYRIHLAVVLPVGLAMFVLPVWAQTIWPWTMSPINIRLLGAFFLGAAVISFWCQRQSSWHTVLSSLALYAVFASAATVASVVHFGLFDPGRVITWIFFGLYVFVAAGAWYFLARYPDLMKTLRHRRAS